MNLTLWRKRNCYVPTWRGWLLLVIFTTSMGWLGLVNLYPFLAPNDPVRGDILVVEGWATDHVLQQSIVVLRKHPYQWVVVTGPPLEKAYYLAAYKTFAEVGANTLKVLGVKESLVVAVPSLKVVKDRTYECARALRQWLDQNAPNIKAIDLVTQGPHARRSRLLFRQALGERVKVGIVAAEDEDYRPDNWWRTSKGFREVIGEAIAYIYARFFFNPARS